MNLFQRFFKAKSKNKNKTGASIEAESMSEYYELLAYRDRSDNDLWIDFVDALTKHLNWKHNEIFIEITNHDLSDRSVYYDNHRQQNTAFFLEAIKQRFGEQTVIDYLDSLGWQAKFITDPDHDSNSRFFTVLKLYKRPKNIDVIVPFFD